MNITAGRAASLLDDVEVRASLDTVELFFHTPPKRMRSRLEAAYGRRITFEACHDKTGVRRGFRIILNRPPKAALTEVCSVLSDFPSGSISRMDLAIDFRAKESVLDALSDFIDQHVILKWRARSAATAYIRTSTYWAMNCRSRNLVRYWKKNGDLRLELRFLNTASVRRAGFDDPAQIFCLNPAELISHNLRIRVLKPDWIDRTIRRFIRHDRARHLRKRLESASSYAHPLLDRYRARIPMRIRDLFSKIDMQNFVTGKTAHFTDALPISLLKIPEELSWSA